MYLLYCACTHACPFLYSQRNGKHILWEHLQYLQQFTQAESGLYVGRRLTYEHINLTSYSKMKVNLAAQVCIYGLLCILVTSFLTASTHGGRERESRRENQTWIHIGATRMSDLKYVNTSSCVVYMYTRLYMYTYMYLHLWCEGS